MEKFTVGSVVTVRFPFSNLKGQKVRPALILAQSEKEDLILCQITSKPFSSNKIINIISSDFLEGKLPVDSFVRPNKLFTAHHSIIGKVLGTLNQRIKAHILKEVQNLFED